MLLGVLPSVFRTFQGSKRGAWRVLLSVFRTFYGSKRVAFGVLLSVFRTFSGSKRGVLEGFRGSLLRVLKVVRVWTLLSGFERFWAVLGGSGRF